MSNDLIRLERIRAIPDNAVKQEDSFTFFLVSQSDKNEETIYMVYFKNQSYQNATCTCKDWIFRNTEVSTDYECKHIGKVRDMLFRRLTK
jgi:hypothetical protein